MIVPAWCKYVGTEDIPSCYGREGCVRCLWKQLQELREIAPIEIQSSPTTANAEET